MPRLLILALLLFNSCSLLAWNALGHRLIAQIAYDHLIPAAKKQINFYNQSVNEVYLPRLSFVNAAPWLDSARRVQRQQAGLRAIHYIDTPFSLDKTPLVSPATPNALTAIARAQSVLDDPHSFAVDKGLSIRILLHVIGDLHQPLHAADQYSRRYPKGDLGGNRFRLGKNQIANNLHAYWDRGGGFLLANKKVTNRDLRMMATLIEKKWPCKMDNAYLVVDQWRAESFELAVNKVYFIASYQTPSWYYQRMVQKMTQQQIALAGCRVAMMMNDHFATKTVSQ